MTRLPKGYLDMGRDDYVALDFKVQCAVYAELCEIAHYTMGTKYADASISTSYDDGWHLGPVGWIMAVKAVTCKCERCRGTGTYYWGACINGRMTHSAPCARCGGKGWMTFDDMRRGRAYDNHAIARAARG